ncbi:unnamed protein product [Dicrocoelium dendriticum]|nr:unnamed protein product [Dicrocoelium dendriticum]
MVKFSSNHLYTYAFEIVHRIDAAWIEKQDVKEHIMGKMRLSVGSNCLSSLQILNISLTSRTESLGMNKAATMGDDLFKQELLEAIWFCYDNGRISAFQWRAFDNALVANLKGALLSQLQVSASSTHLPTFTTEEDILGDCVTEYAPESKNHSGIMFTKIKYSTGCARRVTLQSILTAVEIQPPSQRSRIPFMDGTVQCELYLGSDGIISASHCEEKLVVGTVNSLLDDRPTTVITTVRLRLLQMQASDGVLTTARHFKRLFQKTTNAESLTMEMVLKMKEELLALAFTKEKRDIRNWYLFVQKLRLLDAQALQLLQHVILSTDDLKMR